MKKFVLKFVLITLMTFVPIVSCNYFVDPANRFREDMVSKVAEYLNEGYIVETPANMDEGLLQEKRISTMGYVPKTVIIGSSHIMYIPFDYDDTYNAGMSGSYLGDYYAIVGLLKYYNKMPKRIVIGVDPWAFLRDSTDGYWVSLKPYSFYLKRDIVGSSFFSDKVAYGILRGSKLMELYSLAYFRSSLSKIKSDGLPQKSNESVAIVDDTLVSEKSKIATDGRRISAKKGFQDIVDIEKDVDKKISSGNIYQFGKGFTQIPDTQWDEFVTLIQYLRDNGIEVVLYLPAWHPRVYELFATDDEYSGVLKVENKVRIFAKKNDIVVHGGYNPANNNFNTEDFMDWLHLKPNKMYEDYQSIQ
ncbi:MAG: hypothetical protein E7198_07925 [Schwartzia succinivorans]|uniref:hypothetical protein n=1 Tax=Schwartzia succinivorans TaxID=55507 RepID=UPI00235479DF|nr:hypothetical protein [Schwartzia succinivorans]MBE6097710.1 hypothetical protein [Schwartzia succinivorans]